MRAISALAIPSVKPPAQRQQRTPSIQELRDAIPARCFERSTLRSSSYIARDCLCVAALFWLASHISAIENDVLRSVNWAAYGFVQGCLFTGIWILAHECGHQALFNSSLVNDSLGFLLHSFLLVPYFSWKYSHSKHHRYHNNMEKDTAFVPPRKDEMRPLEWIQQVLHAGEDTPILSMLFLAGHQLVGWPVYLLTNITAGKGSASSTGKPLATQSHFDPRADLFTNTQRAAILMSDFGLLTMMGILWQWSRLTSVWNVCMMFGLPYLWVNHWLIAITFLHHNHAAAVHYEAEAWSFREAALSTVDRDFGWIGREIMHGIIEYHVIHHFFTKIPFYHAEEATEAIKPLLGDRYLVDRTPMWQALYETFTSFRYVEPSPDDPNILVWVKKQTPVKASRSEPEWDTFRIGGIRSLASANVRQLRRESEPRSRTSRSREYLWAR